MWKFINCTLKDIMSTKTMKELCVSWQFSFVFGCGLSASAGNLLKLFSHYCKNWPMQVICCAGKWVEITVTLVFVFSILFSLHSCGNDKENLFDNQKLLKLVIISFILMTFTFNSRVILYGEIRSQTHFEVKGLNLCT